MDGADQAADFLTRYSSLLNEYRVFSYPVLVNLLAIGLILVGIHFFRNLRRQPGLPIAVVAGGVVLVVVGGGGISLKAAGEAQIEQARQDFIASHRVPPGERRLLVFDLVAPPTADAAEHAHYRHLTERLVAAMSQVLREDLPPGFEPPRVVRVPTSQSPWRTGIGPEEFEDVIRELNAFEIVWGGGTGRDGGTRLFIGLPHEFVYDIDTLIPLHELRLDEDPRRGHEFGDDHHRLLGLVALGIALDSYRQARQQPHGEARRRALLRAVAQFGEARALVNNRRNDPVLQRSLYSQRLDTVIQAALKEAGLAP